jgi:hypothetical protein
VGRMLCVAVKPPVIPNFDYFAALFLFGSCLVLNNSNQILSFNQLDAHQYGHINTLTV